MYEKTHENEKMKHEIIIIKKLLKGRYNMILKKFRQFLLQLILAMQLNTGL